MKVADERQEPLEGAKTFARWCLLVKDGTETRRYAFDKNTNNVIFKQRQVWTEQERPDTLFTVGRSLHGYDVQLDFGANIIHGLDVNARISRATLGKAEDGKLFLVDEKG